MEYDISKIEKVMDSELQKLNELHLSFVIERSSDWFNEFSGFEKWLKYCKMIGINTRKEYREVFTEQEVIDIYEYHEAINAL